VTRGNVEGRATPGRAMTQTARRSSRSARCWRTGSRRNARRPGATSALLWPSRLSLRATARMLIAIANGLSCADEAARATHLCAHVIPDVPVRQFGDHRAASGALPTRVPRRLACRSDQHLRAYGLRASASRGASRARVCQRRTHRGGGYLCAAALQLGPRAFAAPARDRGRRRLGAGRARRRTAVPRVARTEQRRDSCRCLVALASAPSTANTASHASELGTTAPAPWW